MKCTCLLEQKCKNQLHHGKESINNISKLWHFVEINKTKEQIHLMCLYIKNNICIFTNDKKTNKEYF